MFVNCILDSGAFVVWAKRRSIDIDEYIDYCLRNKEYIQTVVNLDSIPGEPGRNPTLEEVEYSAKKSFETLQYMKSKGVNAIPVFHQGESFDWLHLYLETEPYIGVSPAEDTIGWRGADPRIWLDRVYTHITDQEGRPLIKTHGFGVTAFNLLIRYPWTTVDSTSYTQLPNYGKILVPKYSAGQPDYLHPPIYIHISDRTKRDASGWSSARDKSKDQFGNLSPIQQDHVIHFVTKICGQTMTSIRYCDNARRICVIKYWQNFAEALGDDVRFRHRIRTLQAA